MSEVESLDTRGLLCPLPVIRTQNRVRDLQPGSLLSVIATDPGTLQDIPAWCRVHGHELLETETVEGQGEDGPGWGGLVFRFRIRVAADC